MNIVLVFFFKKKQLSFHIKDAFSTNYCENYKTAAFTDFIWVAKQCYDLNALPLLLCCKPIATISQSVNQPHKKAKLPTGVPLKHISSVFSN